MNAHGRCFRWQGVVMAVAITGCATQAPAPAPTVAAEPLAVPAATAPAAPVLASPPVTPAPLSAPSPPPPAKEAPLVDLPSYAKRGKRQPADGGAPGRAVLSYCRSFEIEKDASAYFRRLQREKRLPTEAEVGERNRQTEQTLTVQQYVERDWALRRDNNKSAPQKCKFLAGSVDGSTAHVVFEADLNGRRQRGTATVVVAAGKWHLRDHGDWVAAR